MAWTATVINKDVTNGVVRIDIDYANGPVVVHERVESRSGQSETWLTDTARRRIAELTGLQTLYAAVTIGPLTIPAIPPPANTPRDEFERKLNQFQAALNAARMGLITEDAAVFANLRNWLRTNFLPEYIDLFL